MANKTKRGLRWRRKTFQQALNMELREHKSSFIVFCILRLLVIVTLTRQIMLQNYESVFLCALTLLLLYVPSWVQVELRIELPPPLEITVLCFIFAAEILGEINAFLSSSRSGIRFSIRSTASSRRRWAFLWWRCSTTTKSLPSTCRPSLWPSWRSAFP